jgi:hypothetical protein
MADSYAGDRWGPYIQTGSGTGISPQIIEDGNSTQIIYQTYTHGTPANYTLNHYGQSYTTDNIFLDGNLIGHGDQRKFDSFNHGGLKFVVREFDLDLDALTTLTLSRNAKVFSATFLQGRIRLCVGDYLPPDPENKNSIVMYAGDESKTFLVARSEAVIESHVKHLATVQVPLNQATRIILLENLNNCQPVSFHVFEVI